MRRRATLEEQARCNELGCGPSGWKAACPLHGATLIYVLYNDQTADYPGEWVVRRQLAKAGEISRDAELSARGKTKEECVKNFLAKPFVGSMTYLARDPSDDQVIEGTFV